jgi:hypothetical protein
VLADITAVASGAIAAIARKGSPRHIRGGRWYYRAITVVFITATILAAMRWRHDYHLFILGAIAAAMGPPARLTFWLLPAAIGTPITARVILRARQARASRKPPPDHPGTTSGHP